MVRRKTTGTLKDKLGTPGRKAFDNIKDDEVRYSTAGDLPAGIEGGIAELSECKFDVFKTGDSKGEYYFSASGTVISPRSIKNEEGETIHIEGLQTRIGPEPLCETPSRSRKTLEEHLGWINNHVKMLGAESDNWEILEEVLAALKQQAPRFKFRTWQGNPTEDFPNPRVNHQWNGVKGISQEDEELEDGVEDSTEESDEETTSSGEKDEDTGGLTELGKLADDEDVEAQKELEGLCKKSNIDPKEIQTWVEVATLLLEGGSSEGKEDSSKDEEEEPPEKGEVYYFKPPKKRNKVQVEITAVVKSKQTCNLKEVEDESKTYKSILWNKLGIEE